MPRARPIECKERVMRNPGRRIGRAIGMGLTWGSWLGAGALTSALVERVPGIDYDLPFGLLFAPCGFIAGIMCSEMLGVIEDRRGFHRVSRSLVAGCGAAGGLLTAVVIATLRGEMSEFLVFGPILALAGAVLAAGSLAVVLCSERAPLPGPSWGPTKA
jgi:hypothetical protein